MQLNIPRVSKTCIIDTNRIMFAAWEQAASHTTIRPSVGEGRIGTLALPSHLIPHKPRGANNTPEAWVGYENIILDPYYADIDGEI